MDISSGLRRAADELDRLHAEYPDPERMPAEACRMLAWVHYTCLQAATLLTPVIGEELANHNLVAVRRALDRVDQG